MGHATRCLPVIRACRKKGAEVIVMGSASVLKRIKLDFPDIRLIEEELYVPVYSKRWPAWIKIIAQGLFILKSERSSYSRLQTLIKDEGIDLILSDNRYFVYSELCRSVLISHQLNPRTPSFLKGFQWFVKKRVASFCRPFQEVWVPDSNEKRPLSGDLSINHLLQSKIKFCGFLSRFEVFESEIPKGQYDLLILSGPAPQPQLLLDIVASVYRKQTRKLQVISSVKLSCKEGVVLILNPGDAEFKSLVSGAQNIICRSGYSTIMDLLALNRRALLIPTPGQTEQEYLADHLQGQGFTCVSQSALAQCKNPDQLPFPEQVIAKSNRTEFAIIDAMVENELNRSGLL